MNIFYLDNNPTVCAQQHCNKHVVKMVVETSQLLSTAHRVLDDNVSSSIYKIAHKNHPSAIWCRTTSENYKWLYRLLVALLDEYECRYEKSHKCWSLIPHLVHLPRNIQHGPFSPPPLAMPDEYKVADTVESYRNYYRGAKSSFAKWKNRPTPDWFML
jgi:hypothetical protein